MYNEQFIMNGVNIVFPCQESTFNCQQSKVNSQQSLHTNNALLGFCHVTSWSIRKKIVLLRLK